MYIHICNSPLSILFYTVEKALCRDRNRITIYVSVILNRALYEREYEVQKDMRIRLEGERERESKWRKRPGNRYC